MSAGTGWKAFAAALALSAGACGGGDAMPDDASRQAPAVRTVANAAWVRLPAVPGRPAAGYLRIAATAAPRTLVRVASPAATRIELHESMASGGAMAMRPLAALPIPAGQAVTFRPGGQHLMMFDVSAAAGATVPLTLYFADGTSMTVDARAIAAGDAPPEF